MRQNLKLDPLRKNSIIFYSEDKILKSYAMKVNRSFQKKIFEIFIVEKT